MATPLPWDHSMLRLLETARLLRKNKRVTIAELADLSGSSVRTAKRDMQLLRAAGWEIRWDAMDYTYVLVSAPEPVLI